MELFKLLNTFSPDLMKEIFSLNDASVLNPDMLSEQKMAHSFSTKNMRACVKQHKKFRITNNIPITH